MLKPESVLALERLADFEDMPDVARKYWPGTKARSLSDSLKDLVSTTTQGHLSIRKFSTVGIYLHLIKARMAHCRARLFGLFQEFANAMVNYDATKKPRTDAGHWKQEVHRFAKAFKLAVSQMDGGLSNTDQQEAMGYALNGVSDVAPRNFM